MHKFKTIGLLALSIALVMLLSACGGGGGGSSSSATDTSPSGDDSTNTDTLQSATVTGTLQEETNVASFLLNMLSVGQVYADVPSMVYLDDEKSQVMLDADGNFTVSNIADGDHSLFWEDETTNARYEFEFRMAEGRGLDFGTITINDGKIERFTGFNGYHFGFVDEDGDGVNDNTNFIDTDDDGICDAGSRYAGYPYMRHRQGFGFVDEDGDEVNDRFRDADGDGICDITGMPYSHGFGWVDLDNEGEPGYGVNDLFTDANGDGINDITLEPYVAMPGWADLDSEDEEGYGKNDFFADADGDGICDITGIHYSHGFGFVDKDGDEVNDRFVDADGDGINDYVRGTDEEIAYRYGFQGHYQDSNGDGITDDGRPYRQCFGWVDSDGDGDGINDVFTDAEGDGLNDVTNYSYTDGFVMGSGGSSSPMWSND
jgi:hypothetical protein